MPHPTNQMAQAELHRRLYAPLRGYLIRLGASPEEADDLIADTFVVAINKWSSRQPGKEVAWVYGIARKKVLEHRKERGRFRHSVATGAFTGTFTIDTPASAQEQCEASERFLELSAGEQEVVHLIYMAKLSHQDVADLRGTTVSAVSELLRSARARLAKGELDVA